MNSDTDHSLGSRINRWPRWFFSLIVGATAIVVCAFFYPPRLEVWARRDPRMQEWSRADSFLKQSQHPLTQEVEPAVRWRILPPLVSYVLGLKGRDPLALCWLGLGVLTILLAARLESLGCSRPWAALGTVGFATTGPYITNLDWLGFNDGWYMLALLETAAGRTVWGLVAWAFVGPWIDERFLFGLPLALFVRARLQPKDMNARNTDGIAALAGIMPYLLFRTAFSLMHGDQVSEGYVSTMIDVFKIYLPFVPLGWWMGFRVGLLALTVAIAAQGMNWKGRVTGVLLSILPLTILAVLAWDLDRSTGILIPLYVLGIVAAARQGFQGATAQAARRTFTIAALCLIANLALPYAHIVGPTVSWNRGPFGIWSKLAGR